jgi:hypothetical protein
MSDKFKIGDIVIYRNNHLYQYLVTAKECGLYRIQCITTGLDGWKSFIQNEDEYEKIGNIFNNKKEK